MEKVKYKVSKKSYIKELFLPEGDIVIIDTVAPNWLKTSLTGKKILESLEEEKTIEELTEIISQYYKIPAEVISETIFETVRKFYEFGILETTKKNEQKNFDESLKIERPKLESLNLQQLWVNVTESCNLNCLHCFARTEGEHKFINVNKLIDIFEEAKTLGVQEIVISGGEPTIHPEIEIILKCVRNINNWKIKLLTNGTFAEIFCEERKLRKVIDYIDDIQVSFDGVKSETHDAIRGYGSFGRAYETMLKLSNFTKIKKGVSFTPLPQNVNEILLLFNFALDLKADYIHLNRPKYPRQPLNFSYVDIFLSEKFAETIFSYYDQLIENSYKALEDMRGLNLHIPIFDISFDPAIEMITPLKKERCSAGILTIAISADGNAFPCAALMGRNLLNIGNVFKEGLEQVYKRGRNMMMELFSVDKDNKCRECVFRYFCGGGCRATAKSLNEHDYLCEIYRKRFLDILSKVSLSSLKIYTNHSKKINDEKKEIRLRC